MKLRVDLLPHGNYPDVVLVVDALRATTTAVAYLERGAQALLLTSTPEVALALREQDRTLLLAGERGGLPIPGFDFGNSPAEAGTQNFAGRTVVMNTSNGTGAAHIAAQSGRHVLLAALTNAHAAARRAHALASEGVSIVCAGTDGRVGLEDVYTAGVLAEYLLAMGEFTLDDGARIALTVRRGGGDPVQALAGSDHGVHLAALGVADDVRLAAGLSTSTVVPTLERGEGEPQGALRFVAG
ncbi:2-phosphosulfolactate phosphatase [Deinococcus frigens]|uniref:2-phosphosulfolactate phosphatase n=1 Tax=Deinococcus frigens TaxID=249403 RepID=UPI0004982655|nr:2-phosphosulfolactate phosphatase [Deinococcus frigens]